MTAGENQAKAIVGDFAGMPLVMKRLAVAQFFSWSALFIMWINTTPVVAQNFYHAPDPASAVLDYVPNPRPGQPYLVRFSAPEFTARQEEYARILGGDGL